MLRLGLVIAGFTLLAAGLIALQWCLAKLKVRGRRKLSVYFYRALCRLLRVRVRVVGAPIDATPVLIVANHASWLDIPVIASIMPAAFVSKSEVRGWPLVGLAAELTGAVFVDRTRRQSTAEVNAAIAERMTAGDPVVLFAEGTSSDGNRVLQFRSALVGATSGLIASDRSPDASLQPLSIVYTHVDGLPMGRQHRPLVAWYGDTDFMPHLRDYVRCGAVDVVVTIGEPVAADGMERKAVVKSLESTVRRLTSAALRGERAAANTA